MNYNNCYNKTPCNALYVEHKHHQPLGSANNVQRFHKTLQHLSSKKNKQKNQIYSENLQMTLHQAFLATKFVTTSQ